MSRIVVNNNLTLDGVMQAPGRPDEDLRGGFEHGGWALPYFDPIMGPAMAEGDDEPARLLLGRRTYEDFASVWPNMPPDNPFTALVNDARKYVASRSLEGPLSWNNSVLLEGEALETVAELKAQPGKDIVVLGSGVLVQSLMFHGLIDEYRLLIHPLVLGYGRRMFTEGGPYAELELVDTQTTSTGVIIATYRPAK